jgi:perosamine synthetase
MLNELNKLIPFFKNSKREIIFSEPNIGLSEIKAVKKVLKSKFLSSGEQVELFESEFSSYNSVPFSVAVNSGTSALHLSLLALGVGPGDEVIVPAFTFAATANAVSLTGAKPIFCDIENDYYCIEPKQIENLISVKTKAIIPVHLFGHPSDMLSIKALATKHNCYVIEDAAQAHGASIAGKMAGSWGDVGCFSFYPTKNMTSGEGGMVTTHSYGLVRKIKLLRNQGMDKR